MLYNLPLLSNLYNWWYLCIAVNWNLYSEFVRVISKPGIQHMANALNPYAAGGYFCQYKMMQNSWKMTETLAYGYSSESTPWELSNEYQHGRVKIFPKVFAFLCIGWK